MLKNSTGRMRTQTVLSDSSLNSVGGRFHGVQHDSVFCHFVHIYFLICSVFVFFFTGLDVSEGGNV